MASVFSYRSHGYQSGVVLLFFATVVFIVGYSVPYWAYKTHGPEETSFFGLWMLCASETQDGFSETICGSLGVNFIYGWFHAVRTLESLCLLGLLASCVLALVTNCCRTVPGPHNRALEILASLSGLLGFLGCMVWAGMVRDHLHFGFYFTTIGSALCVVAAIIVAVNNGPIDSVTQGVNVVPTATVHQGQGQFQPAWIGGFHGGNDPQSYGYHQPQGQTQGQSYPALSVGFHGQPQGQFNGSDSQSYGYDKPQGQGQGHPAARGGLEGQPQAHSYGNDAQSYCYDHPQT